MNKYAKGLAAAGILLLAFAGGHAFAQAKGKYDPGASDTEIKVGQTAPYSGPVSALAEISKTTAAYITSVNEAGGVNGRRITFVSLDDAYSPPKTLEQTRKLVEQDEVLFIYNQVGTPTATAAQRYLNSKGVPQVFALTGSEKFNDPASPWSSSSMPSSTGEAAMFARYVAANVKNAKVAILFQNDDYGKDYVKGFKGAIDGNKSIQVVKEASYESTDPTIDSQIATLAASGADVFLNVTAGRAASQSLTGLANTQWRPVHLMNGPWADIETVFKPAGLEKANGIISVGYLKSPSDPALASDPGMAEYLAFMKKYRAGADPNSLRNIHGYLYGQVLVQILKDAGNNLTRQNINKLALSMKDAKFGVLLPALQITTTTSQRHLIGNQQMRRFNGEKFVAIDDK